MSPLTAAQKDHLAWLVTQRDRREAGHPETIHSVTLELPTHNLWAAQLDAMAALQNLTPAALLHRYLVHGLEADLEELLAAEGHRIGRTPRTR